MEKEEAINRLKELQKLSKIDAEIAHSQADTILLAIINDAEIVKEWAKVKKWYA